MVQHVNYITSISTKSTTIKEKRFMSKDNPTLIESATFPRHVIAEIQRAAKTGIYDIRGFGAKREIPTFDDLVFFRCFNFTLPLRRL